VYNLVNCFTKARRTALYTSESHLSCNRAATTAAELQHSCNTAATRTALYTSESHLSRPDSAATELQHVQLQQSCNTYSVIHIRKPFESPVACIITRQHTSAHASTRQRTSAQASIRQQKPAYVSTRQLTSAYVSIRQHTSAHV
jgi:hypothetical protein